MAKACVLNRWYNETLGPRPVWDGDLFVSSECPCSEPLNFAVKTVVPKTTVSTVKFRGTKQMDIQRKLKRRAT